MKHSKGPWSKDGTEIRGAYASSGIVAVTPTIEDGGVIERVANARLVAAAPELLEACKFIRGALHGIIITPKDLDVQHAYGLLDEAIAKAENE